MMGPGLREGRWRAFKLYVIKLCGLSFHDTRLFQKQGEVSIPEHDEIL